MPAGNIDAIFAKLDERISMDELNAAATGASSQQIGEAKTIAGSTTDKEYRRLVANGNCTSFSKLATLHSCPRLYELEQLKANSKAAQLEPETVNLDFAFGHSVGAGIQTYGATKNLVAAQWAAFLSWRAPWDAEAFDKRDIPKYKSLTWALYAVEKFAWFMEQELSDWEVLRLPNSNKPAVELSFGIDCGNGYFHFGHIDAVLQHKETKKIAVWEGKTTTFESVEDAVYGNSYQALGYSVVLDALADQLSFPGSDYEVFYIVYSSKAREFTLLPFTKNKTQRAEWLQDMLLSHATLDTYKQLQFFPKRGDNCINKYGRKCQWYGQCHMKNSSLLPGVEVGQVASMEQVESVDFKFSIAELVAAQKKGA